MSSIFLLRNNTYQINQNILGQCIIIYSRILSRPRKSYIWKNTYNEVVNWRCEFVADLYLFCLECFVFFSCDKTEMFVRSEGQNTRTKRTRAKDKTDVFTRLFLVRLCKICDKWVSHVNFSSLKDHILIWFLSTVIYISEDLLYFSKFMFS